MPKVLRKLEFSHCKTEKKKKDYSIKGQKQTEDQGYRQSVHGRKSAGFFHVYHHCKDHPYPHRRAGRCLHYDRLLLRFPSPWPYLYAILTLSWEHTEMKITFQVMFEKQSISAK